MAQKTVTTLVDDFDGTEASVTRWLTVDGKSVRLDLTDANSARLDEAVAEFLRVGTAVRAGKGAASRRSVSTAARGQSAAVREWANANGYDLKSRGRIPAEVQQAYNAAHAD